MLKPITIDYRLKTDDVHEILGLLHSNQLTQMAAINDLIKEVNSHRKAFILIAVLFLIVDLMESLDQKQINKLYARIMALETEKDFDEAVKGE